MAFLANTLKKFHYGRQNQRNGVNARNRFKKLFHIEKLEERTLLAGFNFPEFNSGNAGSLHLLGNAAVNGSNQLRLTPSVSGTGAAWYTADKVIVAGNFESTFQFKLSTATGGSDGSDGFAFVIQNSNSNELRGGGSGLGYDGMPNSVAVEFDAWQSNGVTDPFNDPSQSHVAVHTNGSGANGANESFRIGTYYNTSGFILDNAQVHTARVRYTPGTMKVFLDNLTTPVLTVPLNINTSLNLDQGRAWIGFTGATSNYVTPAGGPATGGSPLNQDFLSWSFQGDDNLILGNGPSVIEGAAGTTSPVNFTLSRLGNLTGQATVNWSTSNGTATAGTDYVAASGQVIFENGESSKSVAVTVTGDNSVESNETFQLLLSTTSAYTAVAGQATILTDDVAISIGNDTATEGSAAIRPLGSFVATGLGGLVNPYAMVIGPDGKLYVSGNVGAVYRYDAITGASLPSLGKSGAEFVSNGSGGFNGVRDIAFGPDGFLYAVSENTDSVLRYDPITGAPAGLSGLPGDAVFITSGAGGLDAPRGLIFRNNYVYVTSVGGTTPAPGKDSVLRYDASTGAPAGLSGQPGDAVFIASGIGGLDNPSRIVFGPDGMAYVSSTATTASSATSNSVLRFNASTGAAAGVSGQSGDAVFVSPGSGGLDGPIAMAFQPDGLYVTGWRSNSVNRYLTSNGTFAGQVVSPGSGGLNFAVDLLFDSNGNYLVTSKNTNQVLRYGASSQFAFTVNLSSASAAEVIVQYATTDITASAGSDYLGVPALPPSTLTFAPGETTKTILIQSINDNNMELAETFRLNLSNATGGVITSGVAIGTIIDDDSTKFYVVNDGSQDRTYEYGATGNSIENYTINSGNTAPRGVATTAAGDIVWVVDANKKVYVYNNSGGLLGSWTAGSLPNNATVEGITTNGVDVWIVDSKSDAVYKFAGAASRTSGSQNAASSFRLQTLFGLTGNTNAKDIVTDGTSIWIVDDSATDVIYKGKYSYVYKYTVNGTYLGSWGIDLGNVKPTGLTIDPTGVSQSIWVVDSGTKRVYEYVNARSRTTDLQEASRTFALAAGNTNPQGIADPPPPSAFNSLGRAPDLQSPFAGSAPMPWFSGAANNVGLATLPTVPTKVRSTDEWMSVLGLAFEQPKLLVNSGRMTKIVPNKMADRSSRFEAEMQVDNIDDLIGLVATDLSRHIDAPKPH